MVLRMAADAHSGSIMSKDIIPHSTARWNLFLLHLLSFFSKNDKIETKQETISLFWKLHSIGGHYERIYQT
jgi:hypothetical protein